MSELDIVLESYRDMFGVKTDRANEIHRLACEEVARLRAAEQGVHPTPLTLFGMRVEIANWLKPGQWFIRPSRRG